MSLVVIVEYLATQRLQTNANTLEFAFATITHQEVACVFLRMAKYSEAGGSDSVRTGWPTPRHGTWTVCVGSLPCDCVPDFSTTVF